MNRFIKDIFKRQGVWGTGAGFLVCVAVKAKQTEKNGHKFPNKLFEKWVYRDVCRRLLDSLELHIYNISNIVKDFPLFCRRSFG